MQEIVRHSYALPEVTQAVHDATRRLPDTASDYDIVCALFWWIRSHIEFSEDEDQSRYRLGMSEGEATDTELLITPGTLLTMEDPKGDCDDFSTLFVTFLAALDIPSAFVTIAADPTQPRMFSHVFVKAWLPDENEAVYLDASHGPFPGWEHNDYDRKTEWPNTY